MAKWLLCSHIAAMKEAFGLVGVRQNTKVGFSTLIVNEFSPRTRLGCCSGLEFCCCKLVIPDLTSRGESNTAGSITPRKQSRSLVWLAHIIRLNLAWRRSSKP